MPEDAVLHVYDFSLARCATGRSCSNLREPLGALRTVSEAVLERHIPKAAVYRIRRLLCYAGKRERMGETGHDFARDHFLFNPQFREYLTMMLCLDHPETSPSVGSRREGILQH